MIQALPPHSRAYALRLLGGVAPGTRVARQTQSAAASLLLRDLKHMSGIAEGASSKAHSRALCAAAISNDGAVGIDIEYMSASRDIVAVASWLSGTAISDAQSGYRLFTFREAYFKAAGEFPSRAALLEAAKATAPRFESEDGWSVFHDTLARGFALTLVWRGDAAPVRYDLPQDPEGRL